MPTRKHIELPILTAEERDDFLSRIAKSPTCWRWTGSISRKGYGLFSIRAKTYMAHRVSFVMNGGVIPPGLFACHRCDVTYCVNPDHLFAGTQLDNMRDAKAKGRCRHQSLTSCKRGHPFSPENTGQNAGRRYCRKCACMREMRNLKLRKLRLLKSDDSPLLPRALVD